MIDKGMNKSDLIEKTGISSATMAKLGKNKVVGLKTLESICNALDCDICDIVTMEKRENENEC